MKTIIKSIIAISVAAAALAACGISSHSSKTKAGEYSYKEIELNCPVKSIDVRTYKASCKFGEVIKGELTYGNYLAEFDKAGNVIRKTEYNSSGDVDFVHMFKYDEKNNNIEEMSYSRKGELKALQKTEYNDAGEIVKYFMYAEDGSLVSSAEHEYEGEYCVRSRYVTNRYVGYDENVATNEEEWVAKRDGERILETAMYRNGKLEEVQKYSTYEENGGLLAECVIYDADGVKLREFYKENDGHGIKLFKLHDFTDDSEYEYRVKRNDRGHIVYIYDSQEEHKETYYEYEYDSKGNWTKKVKFEGVMKKPVEITEREIKY